MSVYLSTLTPTSVPTESSYQRSRRAAESYAQRAALPPKPARPAVAPRRLLARLGHVVG